MVAKLVTVKLENDKQILVEVDEPPVVGVQAVGLSQAGEIQFEAALDNIKTAANKLKEAIQGIADPPNSCEITFGIKLSASAGVILAKAGTEANFSIKMGWSKKD